MWNTHTDQPLFRWLGHRFPDRGNLAIGANHRGPGISHGLRREDASGWGRNHLLDLAKAPATCHLNDGCGNGFCLAGGQFGNLFSPL